MSQERNGRNGAVGRLVAVAVAAVLVACAEGRLDPTRSQGENEEIGLTLMGSCGVSFTATTVGSDPDIEAYGIAADTETVNVCETWTGSDYQAQITVVSTNSPEGQQPDAAHTVTYHQGTVEGYTADGSYEGSEYVGSTSFEMVNATADEVQASRDSPYYGVWGGGGGGGGGGNECPEVPCEDEMMVVGTPAAQPIQDRPRLPGFRHNVYRPGIRHLINSFDEVDRGSKGSRRFHRKTADTDVTLELDAATELLIGEDHVSPRGRARVKHTWELKQRNYVRKRSEYEVQAPGADGQLLTQRTIVTLSNVQWRTR